MSICCLMWWVTHLMQACCWRILVAGDSHSLISVSRPSGAMVSPDRSGSGRQQVPGVLVPHRGWLLMVLPPHSSWCGSQSHPITYLNPKSCFECAKAVPHRQSGKCLNHSVHWKKPHIPCWSRAAQRLVTSIIYMDRS